MKRDIAGQRFGRLVALEPTDARVGGSVVWRCRCDCGNMFEAPVKRLVAGVTRSCGCLAIEPRALDLTGQRFGRLVVVKRAGTSRGRAMWECRCDCGNAAVVAGTVLRGGRTKSCGCLRGRYGGPDAPGAGGSQVAGAGVGAGIGAGAGEPSSTFTNIPGPQRKGFAADLAGRQFGRLTAVRRVGTRGTYALWECRCECGNTCEATSHDLVHGGTRSCGCLRKGAHGKDIAGERFGRLVAVNPTDERDRGSVVWRCLCDCDRVAFVSTRALREGKVTSCGECDA